MKNRKKYRQTIRALKKKIDELECPVVLMKPTEPKRTNEWIVGVMDKYEEKLWSLFASESEKLDELHATEFESEATKEQEKKVGTIRAWLFIYSRLTRRFLLFPEYRNYNNQPMVVETVQKEHTKLDLEISIMIAKFLEESHET
jgi:hypothetical protein